MSDASIAPPPGDRPDWAGIVEGWVAEGLVETAHRDELVRRLQAVPLPRRVAGGMFASVAIVALVTAGLLLIDGSLLTTLALLDAHETLVATVLVCLGLAKGVVAVPIRVFLHRGVAHGFGAAGILGCLTGLLGLGLAERALEPVCLGAGLVAFVVATGLAIWDEAPGVAGAAGLGATLPLLSQLDHSVAVPIVLAASLGWIVVASAVAVVQERAELPEALGDPAVLGVQTPFASFVGVVAIFLHGRWVLSGWNASAYESSILLAFFGGLVLLAGWAAKSRITLVSGIGVILTAQLPALWAFESLVLALVAFGVEGLGLLGVAVLAVMVAARRQTRDSGV